eukprot:1118-Heterococcus_DN1.PRE.3
MCTQQQQQACAGNTVRYSTKSRSNAHMCSSAAEYLCACNTAASTPAACCEHSSDRAVMLVLRTQRNHTHMHLQAAV